jgi:hypothetical protein
MTLALAIAFNAVLALALLGTLVTVMSRAARLKPHVSATEAASFEPVVLPQRTSRRTSARPGMALADVRA